MIGFEGLYVIYLIASMCFILAIRGLSSPKTARNGNQLGMFGMGLAVLATLLVLPTRNDLGILSAGFLAALIGIWTANKVKMTALPQVIALLNGVGGLSSVLVGMAQILRGQVSLFDSSVGIAIGGVAFSGSLIAFFKLQGWLKNKHFSGANIINIIIFSGLIITWAEFVMTERMYALYMLVFGAFLFGATITLPVGGADMPIVISVLNAFSGFAASGIGFSLSNVALIITGALVGASGTILALAMTKAMNRSLVDVFFKTFTESEEKDFQSRTARVGSPQDAAFLMENASKVIIVPGYGMASAGAQYALKNMASILKDKYHVDVKFAIHPVAGRMPGHMNVLLAEAKVDYDKVFGLEEINPDFETADVAYVIGANDITNPLAKTDASSPLYGMPILEVSKAKTVFFVKRSLGAGYSGAQNPLFFADNTLMLYGDAKKVTEEVVANL
ncbi:MAG: NAD(P)(+) transhydrogenase (Re/Si-specific) subunit beta [Alphaproteobacteria bacterium]|nr:NAD(P)(+) transhydrogenase (Re/Si-specific) subunit beta [Alphaproteobacteria bacterium]